jgi:hypothetical protein
MNETFSERIGFSFGQNADNIVYSISEWTFSICGQ